MTGTENRFTRSRLTGDLIRAYETTRYRVFAQPPVELLVGLRNEALAALHAAAGVMESAFLTACNPFSERLPDDENAARQATLASWLGDNGFAFIEGIGEAPEGSWPGEPSYLVLGVSRAAAQEIGRRFEQNAIVWSGEDAVPELVLLR